MEVHRPDRVLLAVNDKLCVAEVAGLPLLKVEGIWLPGDLPMNTG